MTKFQYPHSKKIEQVDDYHGIQVSDPYRWLEDTDSAETAAWIEEQNNLTFDYLESIPAREQIKERMTELWDYAKAQAPFKKGGRYFQLRNIGLQNQDVLFVMDSVSAAGRVLFDPNTLSDDGTIALTAMSVSPGGQYLAYATSASGSDWKIWRVRDIESGQDLPDKLEWSKAWEVSWRKDSSGFYYGRYDAPEEGKNYTGANYYQKLYFHEVNTIQDEDALIYERPDEKEWGFNGQVSDDDCYLILNVWQGTDVRNRLFYMDLQTGGAAVELISYLEAAYHFVGNDGPVFYFHTDLDAPRSRVIAINTMQPAKENWQTLVAEQEDTLEFVKLVNNEFVCQYLHDAYHVLRRYGLDGTFIAEIELPALGSVIPYFTGNREDDEMFFAFWSFLYPVTVFRYDFSADKRELLFDPPIDFSPEPYETRQVFVTSKDGTEIPLFLTHKRGLSLDGQNPALLYGYGGFNISLTPRFDIGFLTWMEMGGVVAWANLRGGGEYGEEWHQAGMKANKQNVFDDFIACGEYLIEKKITSKEKLAIMGHSNGGLLVGACLNQRPDLFGAAIAIVGVMDMLRFQKFTIGWAWVSDYGSADDPEEFKALYAYSPYHNLKPGTSYPPILITTGDHDDRVVPGHSFKYAAALQAAHAGDTPTMIRVQKDAGHGVGKPTAVLIQETADGYAFLSQALGIDF